MTPVFFSTRSDAVVNLKHKNGHKPLNKSDIVKQQDVPVKSCLKTTGRLGDKAREGECWRNDFNDGILGKFIVCSESREKGTTKNKHYCNKVQEIGEANL